MRCTLCHSKIIVQQKPCRVTFPPVFRITDHFEIRHRALVYSNRNVLDGKRHLRINGVLNLDKVYQSHASIEAGSAATTPLGTGTITYE